MTNRERYFDTDKLSCQYPRRALRWYYTEMHRVWVGLRVGGDGLKKCKEY
jgi:hypothetical protein